MQRHNAFTIYFFLLFLGVLFFIPVTFAAGDNVGLIMSEDLCQAFCVDEESGTKYTVAMKAIAWINTHKEDSCGLKVYEYTYSGGEMLEEYLTRDLSPEDESREYDETHTHGFWSGVLNRLGRADIIWKLLFAGYVDVTKSDDIITTTYHHRIDPCGIAGNYVQIEALCGTSGALHTDVPKGIAIGCRIYDDGELIDEEGNVIEEPEGEYSSGLGLETLSPEDYYTHYDSCEENDCEDVSSLIS